MARIAALAFLVSGIAAAQPPQAADQPRPIAGMTVVFSVDLPLDIPGAVLGPGEYVLRLKKDPGRSGDLAQLQLWDASETNVVAELYAVQRSDQGSPESSIITYYEGPTGRRVLKAWNLLRTRYSEQIVYPPAQAAELARITTEPVLSMPLPGSPVVTAAAPEPPAPAAPTTGSASRLEAPAVQPPAEYPHTAGNLAIVLWLGFSALAAFVVFRLYRADPMLAQNARNNAVTRRAAAAAYRTFKAARSAGGKWA